MSFIRRAIGFECCECTEEGKITEDFFREMSVDVAINLLKDAGLLVDATDVPTCSSCNGVAAVWWTVPEEEECDDVEI